MASLEEEYPDDAAGDLPRGGAADDRRPPAAGDVPVVGLAQGPAQKPALGVDGKEGVETPVAQKAQAQPQARNTRPEYEPKEIHENLVLRGNPPAEPLTQKQGALNPTQKLIADYKTKHPDASCAQVGRDLGVSGDVVEKSLRKPQVKLYMSQHLDNAGATLAKAAQVVAEAQEAEHETPIAFMGKITAKHVQPDHKTRIAAAKLSMEAHGALEEKGLRVNVYQGLTDAQLNLVLTGQARIEDFNQDNP